MTTSEEGNDTAHATQAQRSGKHLTFSQSGLKNTEFACACPSFLRYSLQGGKGAKLSAGNEKRKRAATADVSGPAKLAMRGAHPTLNTFVRAPWKKAR